MQTIKRIIPYFKVGLLLLFLAINFRSGLQQLSQARQLTNTDFVEWEKRFDPIKAALPIEYGVIGYATDWDIPGRYYDKTNSEAEHILTQFTMTPIVVSRNANFEWIIVNMNQNDIDVWLAMQEDELEVTKYKYNLYLVHRIK